MDILDLKKQGGTRLEKLQEKFKSNNYDNTDERFWKLSYNKDTKVGSAIIRFIGPAKATDGSVEQVEYKKIHKHFFKKNGKYYVELCPTTIGLKCPVCDANSEVWKNDKDNYRIKCDGRSRLTEYIMNILVVSDPAKPENNGKVFLYKCPKTVFDKIQGMIQPQYEGDSPVNVFDMWSGANFRIRTSNKGEFLNYENSSFEDPSPIFEDVNNTALFDNLWNKLYALSEFDDKSNFKSYEELETKFNEVTKGVSTSYHDSLENHEKNKESKKTTEEILDDSIDEAPWNTNNKTEEKHTTVSSEEFFGDLV